MAKISKYVTLKSNTGATIAQIDSGLKDTGSQADAAVAAALQVKIDAATAAQADLLDAQSVLNS